MFGIKFCSIAYTCQLKSYVYAKDHKCHFCQPFMEHNHGNRESEIKDQKFLAQVKDDCAKATSFS